MKKLSLLFAWLCISVAGITQSFPGLRTGNYRGVLGVISNPANIADSRYKFDFNLISTHVGVLNNKASFSIDDVRNNFDADEIFDQLLDGEGKISSFSETDIMGPSLMFGGKRNSFALTTRGRVWLNVQDIDAGLAKTLLDDETDITFPYNIQNNANSLIMATGWTEFGAAWGRTILEKDHHFLKGGLTVKYLAGSMNASVQINNLNGVVDYDNNVDDYYLRNTTGQIGLNFGGVSLGDFDTDELLNFSGGGAGFDIGFVYEWRPKNGNNENDYTQRYKNKYKFRGGLSVMDIGQLKFDRNPSESGAYQMDINGAERFYLQELSDVELNEFNSVFQKYPQYFIPAAQNNDTRYKVQMPTTLQAEADYYVGKGFYVNAALQVPLKKKTQFDVVRSYTNFMVTPRYEGRSFGFYLPVGFHELSGFNAGASVRLGPLFFGSASILTALFGNSKQVDAHFGLRFGILHHKYKTPRASKKTSSPNPASPNQ